MKFLKKAISLVLVFAMIASFAGMTGFEVSAKRLTYTTDGGITVEMAPVIYKYAESTAYALSSSRTSTAGDSIITKDKNDLYTKFTFPANVTGFDAALSVDGVEWAGLWGTLCNTNQPSMYPSGGRPFISRSADTAQGSDYAVLYTHLRDTKHIANPFKDADTIYWRLKYTTYVSDVQDDLATDKIDEHKNDVQAKSDQLGLWKYEVISVPLVDVSEKPTSSTDLQYYVQPALNDMPIGEKNAGCMLRNVVVPSTLYESNGYIINLYDGNVLNNKLYMEIPNYVKELYVYIVDEQDNILKTIWSYSDFQSSAKSLPSYYNESDQTTYVYGSSDICDKVSNIQPTTMSDGTKAVLYRIEYVTGWSDDTYKYRPNNDSEAPQNVDVRYTQYAASHVQTVPNYKAGWYGDMQRYRSFITGLGAVIAEYQIVDFGGLFVRNGMNMYSTYKDTLDDETRISTSLGSYTKGVYFNIGQVDVDGGNSGDKPVGSFVGGVTAQGSYANSDNTVGVRVMYDPQAIVPSAKETSVSNATGTFSLTHQFTSSAWATKNTLNDIDGYYYQLQASQAPQTWEWNPAASTKWLNTSGNATSTYTRVTSNVTSISNNAIKVGADGKTSTHPSSSIGNNDTSSKFTAYFTLDFNNSYFDTAAYSRLVTHLWTVKNESNALVPVKAEFTAGYHIDVHPVSRTNAHNIINTAINCNYVKAEVTSSWWSNYRATVWNAYIACGNLTTGNSGDVAALEDTCLVKPVYAGADYFDLARALDNADSISKVPYAQSEYTTASWNAYITDLNNAAKVFNGNASSTFVATHDYVGNAVNHDTVNIHNLRDGGGQNAGGLAVYKQALIDKYTIIANNAYKKLEKIADYSQLLARINANDTATYKKHAPAYDVGGSAGYTDGGENWYSAATWSNFVAARNELSKLTAQAENFAYGANYTKGGLGVSRQSVIDNAVAAYDQAKAALAPKTLSEYVWTDTDNTKHNGYAQIKRDIEAMVAAAKTEKRTYYYLDENADLKKDGSYPAYDVTVAEAAMTTLLAKYSADDSIGEKGAAFKQDLDKFKETLAECKATYGPANETGWNDIFKQLSKMYNNTENSITANTILIRFPTLFVDNNNTVYNQIADIVANYAEITKTATVENQKAINDQTELLYNLLNGTSLPAKAVTSAIESAQAAGEGSFVVYNPYNLAAYSGKHELYNAFDDTKYDGIVTLGKYTTLSKGRLNTAISDTSDENSYNLLRTPVADMNHDADTLLAKAGLKTYNNVECLLEANYAKLEVLAGALVGAKTALDMADVTADYYSDPTKNITYSRYTAKTREELRAVYKLALEFYEEHATETTDANGKTVITTTLSAEEQLEVDKIVFKLLDEIENSRNLVSAEDIDCAHWTWTYYDANDAVTTDEEQIAYATCKPANEDVLTPEKWDAILHEAITTVGLDNGLVANNAVYSLLALEVKTPKIGDENVGVWDQDGNIISTTVEVAGKPITVEVGDAMYTNWSVYKEALKAATDLLAEYDNGNGTVLTSEKQDSEIDKVTKALYDARENLLYNDFSGNEHYQEAVNFYNDNVNRFKQFVNVFEYNVSEDKSSTSKSEAIPVNIYNDKAIAEAEAILADFYAKWVGISTGGPTENNTEQAYQDMLAAQAPLVEAINAMATNPEYAKQMNNSEFLVGWNDLIESFIPANYEDLLNDDQIGDLAVLIGAVEELITEDFATADNVNLLVTRINEVYLYTTGTRATNLQFANEMRKQVVEFLQLKFNVGAPQYYTNAPTTLYMFNQEQAGEFIDLIDAFLGNSANWPLIYEVNNLKVAQDTDSRSATYGVYNVEVWPSKTTVTNNDGLTTNVSSGIGADKKIDDIFAQIGAQSTYYKQILLYTNNYYVDQLDWIIKNVFVEDNGETLILADLDGAVAGSTKPYTDSLGNNITINYDVKKTAQGQRWYSEGYGYHKEDNGRVYYLYSSNQTILGSSKGGWFNDQQVTTLQNLLGGTAYNGMQQRLGTKDYTTIGKIQDNPVATAATAFTKYNLTQISNNGWSQTRENNLVSSVNGDQNAIVGAATTIYQNICTLKLLNATQAYRDVINAYNALSGNVYTWTNSTAFSPASGTQGKLDYVVFYNMDEDTFINKIPQDKTYVEATATSPKYGKVVGADLWTSYKRAGYGDDETNWYAKLEDFYIGVKGTTGTNILTIDKAAEVYSYGNDGVDSLYEEFVSIASKLKLEDVDTRWIDAILETFLTGNLSKLQDQTTDGYWQLFQSFPGGAQTFESTASESGLFYSNDENAKSYYTDASLVAFAQTLRDSRLITEDVIKTESGKTTVLVTDINNWRNYRNNVAIQALDSTAAQNLVLRLVDSLNRTLVLRAAETDAIDNILIGDNDGQNGANFAINNEALYVPGDEWDAFKKIYEKITNKKDGVLTKCVDGGEYTAAEDQQTVNAFADELANALAALKRKADSAAPKVEVSVNMDAVKTFYESNAQELEKADAVGAEDPVTGTLFMPNNGGYSLIVYTNEINPRVLIQVEDEKQDINATASIAASKNETISVKSQRTSGTITNLVYGTMNSSNAIVDITNRNLKTDAVANEVKPDSTGPLSEYKNKTTDTKDPTKNEAGSSIFAILAPTFATNKATAAAIYSIEVNDVVPVEGNSGGTQNYANSLVVGNETVENVTENQMITVYIYYHNSMAEGNDEGIFVNNEGKLALATPAYGATHVPSVLFEGELNYNGAWRNDIYLQRGFDSTVRSWEFMSIIEGNEIGGIEHVAYSDPNFGSKNLGSFYYVMNEKTEPEIFAVYKEGKDATSGLMDYDRATAAKTAMIEKINDMTDAEIAKFKNPEENKRFYYYGATDAKGEYVNWTQVLHGKVENGDLVFVHVVDRWGNVVNRIIEITNLDKIAPQVNSAASGEVSINEAGGAGIKDITVHNGDFSLGKFDYEVNQSQKLINGQVANNATVESADNTLTIKGLVPGKLYYIGAYDNAGNADSTPVNASADGKITLAITVDDERVETGEEGSVVNNSTTFTLNGTDTIILNSGEASSIINADIDGNVFANREILHKVTTKDNVTALKTVYQDGTVEEWTTDNSFVDDNGDGTLNWFLPRTLTEGEHSYKVYAKVNGEYEKFYAPAAFYATKRSITLTYMVSGVGRMVLNYSGSDNVRNSNFKSTTIPYGAKVTITAENTKAGCEFYYWMNNYTSRIISAADTYEFTAVTNVYAVAQFTSNSTYYKGEKLVVYVNNAKNVVKAFELADGEGYTVPTGPVLPDYTFKGWSMTKDEVLESDKDTIIVEPIYELNASNTVTITEGNYTATGAGTYTAVDNQRAVATISTSAKDGDGKEFLYWIDTDTDEIVSYDRTYSFFCVKDTVLTPVYGDASTVQAEPIVRITEVKYNALSGKVSFFAERSVPEEFAILQTGIVVTKTESIGTNEEVFVVGGTSTAAGTSTSTANNGYYSANATVATGQTVWARAYVIYETADGEIFEAYGPVVSYTVD